MQSSKIKGFLILLYSFIFLIVKVETTDQINDQLLKKSYNFFSDIIDNNEGINVKTRYGKLDLSFGQRFNL